MSIYTHNYQFISQNVPQYNCLLTLNWLNKVAKTEKTSSYARDSISA